MKYEIKFWLTIYHFTLYHHCHYSKSQKTPCIYMTCKDIYLSGECSYSQLCAQVLLKQRPNTNTQNNKCTSASELSHLSLATSLLWSRMLTLILTPALGLG